MVGLLLVKYVTANVFQQDNIEKVPQALEARLIFFLLFYLLALTSLSVNQDTDLLVHVNGSIDVVLTVWAI